jgi:hypothetical protein
MTDTAKSAILSRPIIDERDLLLDARDTFPLQLERTLGLYDESLLRQVAAKLIKPRNQWPAAELIERCRAAFDNIAVIDRRLRELSPPERRILAMIGHSGQPRWRVIHLAEMSAALGDSDAVQSIRSLLEAGLLFPELPEGGKRLRSFNQWFTHAASFGLTVFTHPTVMTRAFSENLGFPPLEPLENTQESKAWNVVEVYEADGLEWPLLLAALWQLASTEPFRRTQQGEFFKRDQERLRNDPLLNAPPTHSLFENSGMAFLVAELAGVLGILREADGEWRAGRFPPLWNKGILPTLASLWTALPLLTRWPILEGHHEPAAPSFILLFMIFMSRLPVETWVHPMDIQNWIRKCHPGWKSSTHDSSAESHLSPLINFLLALTYHLRMIQIGKDKGNELVVRQSSIGRWLLSLGPMPALPTLPTQTLLVQPNLEIVAYRQGLTSELIADLSHFAAWKSSGAACLLQLQPETVYRALENGYTFAKIQQTLSRHGTRQVPPAVQELLRTWTAKRDRLSIYPSATLFEFANSQDLDDALTRGLPATRLSERLAVVASEAAIDYRHFRLNGTRDYGLPPEKCVDIEPDGVTLTIDPDRSDLLVETELSRFARTLDQPDSNGRRQYRVTSESLGDGQDRGLSLFALEEWFQQRTGQSLSPAIRLLKTAPFHPAAEMKQQLVLHVSSSHLADGLMQLPETRGLFQARLGPTAIALEPEHADELRQRLEHLGLAIVTASPPPPSLSQPGN